MIVMANKSLVIPIKHILISSKVIQQKKWNPHGNVEALGKSWWKRYINKKKEGIFSVPWALELNPKHTVSLIYDIKQLNLLF